MLGLLGGLTATPARAAVVPLTSATIQSLENLVWLKAKGDDVDRPAEKNETIQGGDLLHTGGGGSMAEIGFNDQITSARLGSMSAFSFSPTGSLNVATGLALVSVRDGEVSIQTSAVRAMISSTALIEVFAVRGWGGKPARPATKFILLEGQAVVSTLASNQSVSLRGGQMLVQCVDDAALAEVQEVDVQRLMRESRIITRGKIPLASLAKIQAVVDKQQRELWRGTLERSVLTFGGRGPDRYHLLPWPEIEAPDVPRGNPPPCPTCP